jgi:hypothetical protein
MVGSTSDRRADNRRGWARSSAGNTTLAEAMVCMVAFLCYVFVKGDL